MLLHTQTHTPHFFSSRANTFNGRVKNSGAFDCALQQKVVRGNNNRNNNEKNHPKKKTNKRQKFSLFGAVDVVVAFFFLVEVLFRLDLAEWMGGLWCAWSTVWHSQRAIQCTSFTFASAIISKLKRIRNNTISPKKESKRLWAAERARASERVTAKHLLNENKNAPEEK